MTGTDDNLSALAALLSAYAGRDAARHRLIWALDARLARLVATTSEPMIGQMRLAWWDEALTDDSGVKGRGEPLIDALRAIDATPIPGLSRWLDGWEAMIGEADLHAYGEGRGGGLFHALAGALPDWLAQAGMVWALWDMSGHVGDEQVAARAVAMARAHLLTEKPNWPAAWKPLRIAYRLARQDVEKGRRAPAGLTPILYLRLMRIGLIGR
jgi:hypothetical protein